MSNNRIIPVVFATDDNYVPYCGVAISSLIQNTNKNNKYEIYILYDKLSAYNIYRLENLGKNNVRVNCICIHEYIKDYNILEHIHLTVATIYRLIIPDVLPQYDKIIYLDSDIVVDDDIAELYATDIGKNILGACHGYCKNDKTDMFYKHVTQTLGIALDLFFNAGVLIINSQEFKKLMIKEKCLKLLTERNDLIYMDQCALNLTCINNVYFIDKRWNFEWLKLINEDVSLDSDISFSIFHFDSPQKPWNFPDYPFADLFWRHARNTIFYEEAIKQMNMNTVKNNIDLLRLLGNIGNGKIAVYGAGSYGKAFIDAIRYMSAFKIVAWVDKNYQNKTGLRIPVYPVEMLDEIDFDKLVVAIYDDKVFDEIKKMLISHGIEESKICRYK